MIILLLLLVAVTSAARPLEEGDARNLQNENGTTTNVPHQDTFAPTWFPFDCGWQIRLGTDDNPSNLVGGRYVDISSDGLTLAVGGISNTGSDNIDSGFIQLYQYEEGKNVENQYVGPTWNNVTRISFEPGLSFRMDLSNDGKKLVVLHTNSGQLDLYEYQPPSSTMNDTRTSFGSWEKKEQSQQLILSSEPSSISFVAASDTSTATSSSNISNEEHISDTTTTSSNGESSGYYLAVGLVQEGKVEQYEYSNDRFSLQDELSGGLYQNGEMVEGCFGHSVAQSRDGKVLAIGCP
jgi:hypothetical protein